MLSRIVASGLVAGAAAGVIAALLQIVFLQPVLLHAELYESGELVHFGEGPLASAVQDVGGLDLARDGLSLLFSMLVYGGYGLIAMALMAVGESRGAVIDARHGLVWGLAGFIVVQFAPGVSIAPEVPGVAAADLEARQMWWAATVGASALAMWLIAFGRGWIAWGAGIVLLLAPHVYGAPQPDEFYGPAPPELSALFAARAFGVGMAAWVVLGCLAGYLWRRLPDPQESA
ncbi:MAG: CbtA family protein [Marinibacterium sp.]